MAEQTLIIVKPDGVQRRLIGGIIQRFEDKGFKLVAARFLHIDGGLAGRLYKVHQGKDFFQRAVGYVSSSPAMVMVWQGDRVIETTRKMIGATFCHQAEPGTIRGDLGCAPTYNLVHGSDSPESAEYEIGLFFKPEELVDYELDTVRWLTAPAD